VARRRESTSKLGKWLDPITDKVFIGFTFVGLTIINHSLLIWAVIILLRELVVVVMQNDIEKHGEERISSSWTGKTKMTFQCIAAGLLCLPHYPVVPVLAVAAFVIAVALTIVSGFEYLVAYIGIRKCRTASAR
jgi:CDP-diacylglycerol--glycerol-3-phosphate 3-phosphatidyltransferase